MLAEMETQSKAPATRADVSLSNLQKALKIVAPAIPGASCVIPMLRSVHIEQLPEGLAIQATDNEASVRALIPETTRLAAPLVVPSERLVPWVKLLDGEIVRFSSTEARVTLQCGKAKAAIPRLNFSQPATKYRSDAEGFSMDQVDLLRLLKHTSIAIGDEERFALHGILFEAKGGTLSAVAMDGYRMAVYTRPLAKEFRSLIPERMLRLMLPVITEGKETVTIQESDTDFLASIAADIPVFVSCRKPTGTFPNWQLAMPKDFTATVTVRSESLISSLGRCLLIGDQKSHAIKLEFTAETINLKAVSAEAGEADESVDASNGPSVAVSIGVNGAYLFQALKQMSGDITILLPQKQGHAITLSYSPADGERFDYVVMPMTLPGR